MKTTSRLSSVTGGGVGVLRDLRSLGSVTRLLILSGFAFNLGFFLVLPYLAEHLGARSAWRHGSSGWCSASGRSRSKDSSSSAGRSPTATAHGG